ncbi:MAG: hypothetical protein MR850_09560 [Bacteroidales bacterium]|nr:hypothetical protein [Bacteroidales bacterium]
MDNSFELQQLKEQFNILNRSLNNQQIINERLIRASIESKVRNINSDGRKIMAIAILGIIAIIADHYLVNWSWLFTAVTIVFLLVAVLYNIYFRLGINNADALNADLIDMRLRTLRFKKMQSRWLWFSIPFLVVWLTWLLYETLNMIYDPIPTIIGAAIGLVLGLAFGIKQYQRTQRQAKEIISDIENLKGN